jgi:choline kinase
LTETPSPSTIARPEGGFVRALILAAGHGSRLRPHTDGLPKCLVDIGGTTILEHQLGHCAKVGIDDVAVIVGFEWQKVDAVVDRFIASHPRTRVRTFYNPFFDKANNLVTLWSARHLLDREIVLVNGDDVFTSRILDRVREASGFEIYVSMDRKATYDDDDMKMSVDDAGHVRLVNKQIPRDETHGESIGIMRFTLDGARRLDEELEAMVRGDEGLTDWYTKAIERIARSGFSVGAVSIEGLPWAEIDYPADLEAVRRSLDRYRD